jgi:hypothetical protein
MANPIQTKTANKSLFKVVPETVRKQALAEYKASTLWNSADDKDAEFKDTFFTLKEVKLLEKLLNVIYPKSKFSPPMMQSANDDLIETGTIVKYLERDLKKSKEAFALAFVTRIGKNLFKIFVNEDAEDEAFESMDLHEKGHILFNHTQSVKLYIDDFREELEKIWDTRLMKYFEEEVKRNPKNKEKIVRLLFHEFSNIAQDMEINSKLFEDDQGWFKCKKLYARSAMIIRLIGLKAEIDDMSGMFKNKNITDTSNPEYAKILQNFEIIRQNIKTRLEGEEGDFQFCYPGNKGWPCKLDWMTYMILLVKDLDDTMQQVMKNIKAALGTGQGGNQPMSQDVLDAYAAKMDGDEDAEGAAKDGDADSGDGDDDLDEDVTPSGRSHGGRGQGKEHGSIQVDFESCNNFEDFTKFLRKNCMGKKNRKWNSNPLYNSNRSKFAGNVVVPRRHLIEKYVNQGAAFLIDISGSVSTDLVERAINSIIDTNSGIDLKESRIIFCDTRVQSDEQMSKRTKKVYCGGGTELANGFKHIREKGYCKKSTDLLFYISDFQDNLDQVLNEAEKIKCTCFAIGYGYDKKADANQIFEYHNNKGTTGNSFAARWNRKFKTCIIFTGE